MPFLHFKAHEFCTNMLFYDFHTKFIEISWYWKFVMYMLIDSNLFRILWDMNFFLKISDIHCAKSFFFTTYPLFANVWTLYIPKTFNKYNAWDVFDSRIIKTIHNVFGVWTTSTMMWELWLLNHHKIIGFVGSFHIHAKSIIS